MAVVDASDKGAGATDSLTAEIFSTVDAGFAVLDAGIDFFAGDDFFPAGCLTGFAVATFLTGDFLEVAFVGVTGNAAGFLAAGFLAADVFAVVVADAAGLDGLETAFEGGTGLLAARPDTENFTATFFAATFLAKIFFTGSAATAGNAAGACLVPVKKLSIG
ncbi:hypothetical protein [Variovorax sp. UMC13]|uniref:hypothetical protein n=1 Tax=Variovorax sp. UMC13 TaxID=1862326 RepID=UPI0021805EE2|nr:hypothetical protein [Variovorax sp. UMC13]MBB1603809.1 hypothetical protein [Variovorax sp. UMC13]